MKHLSLIVFAVLCTACVSHRVWEQPAVLHADKNIEVRAIEFHSDSTVVHFTASGRPGSAFRLKENVYLVGDKLERGRVMKMHGISPAKWTAYPASGKADFSVCFSPVRVDTKAVDFIEPGGWMVYGIHDSGKPLKIKSVDDSRMAVRDENRFFMEGTARVSGRYEGRKRPMVIKYYGGNAFQDKNVQASLVEDDGSFSFEIPVEHPVLSYLQDGQGLWPYFYVRAGSSLQMTIDSLGTVHYPSGTCYGRLLEWMSNAKPRIDGHESLSFADYIIRRYRFSREEAHLLKHFFRMKAASDELSQHLGHSRSGSDEDALKTPANYPATRALDPEDWSYFTLTHEAYFLVNYYTYSPLVYDYTSVNLAKSMAEADKAVFGTDEPSVFIQASIANKPGARILVSQTGEAADSLLNLRKAEITSPYLRQRFTSYADRLLSGEEKYYELPECKGSEIFRKLLEPFKGKWVYIDFWSTSCYPCVKGIEASVELRRQIKTMEDFELVFITGDDITPKKAYNEYAAAHLSGENSYRIPGAHYSLLEALFNFSAIPHNELVAPDGRILNTPYLPRIEDHSFLQRLEEMK